MGFNPIDLVRLHSGISGMTPKIMREVLQKCVDDDIALSEIFMMDADELSAFTKSMKPAVAQRLVESELSEAEQTLVQLENKGFKLITQFDDPYPKQYRPHLDAMPPLLYVFGDPSELQKAGVGFGGARDVSEIGLRTTDKLAQQAAKRGLTVISGHAKGVDMIAHQGALQAGGATILVLPEGALKFRLNDALRSYWSEAKERIIIMTQFAPNEPWQARNAMSRNATAICLSKAFFVIESGDEKGGTWSAGKAAISKNVPLYVLDYESPPKSAAGNKKLINLGGKSLPYSKAIILPELGDDSTSENQKQSNTEDEPPTQLSMF